MNFCPFSRKVRFFLEENDIKYELREVKYWLREQYFVKMNQASETPVLKNLQTKEIICDSFLICSYLNEVERKESESNYYNFLGTDMFEKYEIQRLHMWFDKKFYNEITKHIVEEIFVNFMQGIKGTNTDRINTAIINLEKHIKYMEFLLTTRKWLACEKFTIADIAAATQISIVDYLSYIDWNRYEKLKSWYMIIKSKIGFRNILFEKIPGFKQPKHYSKLDF